ncbi:hypothetical protein FGE12_14675 [Aggregicoccus sp. 17bor-14]|uniref:hypothetical protein n=1 Tax=Myxococcaceae TaxID=31 RepID=UPI00129C695C|nr:MULTISPECIES: hypothetical protein [Myxococcaceae]MBF5043638.1 hypothetical protein [Simulacricoccus sp. 17bor-14]MRI89397.1 hypothetical protein [Aggregicoccus sp. 17bor-14]
MENVTQRMMKYREAARHLWNTFLREEQTFSPQRLPSDEVLDDWEALQPLLFRALVLRHTGNEAHAAARLSSGRRSEPLPFLRVVPTSDRVPAMVSRGKPAKTYWDHPVNRLGPEDDLRFIDFFDWDSSRFLDFAYYRVEIRACAREPGLVGHEALLEVQYADVFVDGAAR